MILPTGTKKYYAYTGSPNKDFRYEFKEDGAFKFAVPNVYFAWPNASLTISVSGPK